MPPEPLETECPTCHGEGEVDGHPCYRCNASGSVPTERGEEILELVRHNLKAMT